MSVNTAALCHRPPPPLRAVSWCELTNPSAPCPIQYSGIAQYCMALEVSGAGAEEKPHNSPVMPLGQEGRGDVGAELLQLRDNGHERPLDAVGVRDVREPRHVLQFSAPRSPGRSPPRPAGR